MLVVARELEHSLALGLARGVHLALVAPLGVAQNDVLRHGDCSGGPHLNVSGGENMCLLLVYPSFSHFPPARKMSEAAPTLLGGEIGACRKSCSRCSVYEVDRGGKATHPPRWMKQGRCLSPHPTFSSRSGGVCPLAIFKHPTPPPPLPPTLRKVGPDFPFIYVRIERIARLFPSAQVARAVLLDDKKMLCTVQYFLVPTMNSFTFI